MRLLYLTHDSIPQTGLPVWGSYSLARVACLGPMILTVSPGLRPQSVGSGWSHDFLHLSPICLSFGSHSGSCWSHDFLHLSSIGLSFVSTCLPLWVRLVACFPSLVSHLSFICLPLVSHSGSGWSHDFLHLSPICLSFVSHACLPLWVSWSA